MFVRSRKVKDGPDFCFYCGCELDKREFVLSFGTPATTFELCRKCLKKIKVSAEKALIAKRKGASNGK